MRNLSSTTQGLINRLYNDREDWQWLFDNRKNLESLLRQVSNSQESATIPYILPFILAKKPDLKATAARAIDSLVKTLPLADLFWLDELMRSPVGMIEGTKDWCKWQQINPENIDDLLTFEGASLSIIGVASFHRNGYVREAAIKKLAEYFTGAELPFLLVRLNDWVSNIRQAARGFIEQRFVPEYAEYLVGNIALILRLKNCDRANQNWLIELTFKLLKRPECRQALIDGLTSTDKGVRRCCFQLASESNPLEKYALLENALNNRDSVIRLWSARKLCSELEGDTLDNLLLKMRDNRLMPVRREAVRACVEKLPKQARTHLYSAVLDRHSSIRELARYYLKNIESIDFPSFYRTALKNNDDSHLLGAIAGLGDIGNAADADLVLPFLSHSLIKVRVTALKTAAKLNGNALIPLLIDALMDNNPSISREARQALKLRARQVGAERLGNILSKKRCFHVRKNALVLLGKLGKWESLAFLIGGCGDEDEAIANLAQNYLQRWLERYNSQFSIPTPAQIEHIDRALNDDNEAIEANVREQLLFALQPFKLGK